MNVTSGRLTLWRRGVKNNVLLRHMTVGYDAVSDFGMHVSQRWHHNYDDHRNIHHQAAELSGTTASRFSHLNKPQKRTRRNPLGYSSIRRFTSGSNGGSGGGRDYVSRFSGLSKAKRVVSSTNSSRTGQIRRSLPMSLVRKGREESMASARASAARNPNNYGVPSDPLGEQCLGLSDTVDVDATVALPEVTAVLNQSPTGSTTNPMTNSTENRRATRVQSSFFRPSNSPQASRPAQAADTAHRGGGSPALHHHDDSPTMVQDMQECEMRVPMTVPLPKSQQSVSVYPPFNGDSVSFDAENDGAPAGPFSSVSNNKDIYEQPTLDLNLALTAIDEDVFNSREKNEASKLFDKRAELYGTHNLDVVPTTLESERAKQDRLIGYRVFRAMAPYIAVHYGSVVVIHIPGEVLESDNAEAVMHDIVLLKTLGIKVVLVAGCRPQIRCKLEQMGKKSLFVQGNRVCDTETLYHCQSVAGHVRLYIESLLTRGLMNSPTGIGSVTVTSGNFVRAIAFGVRDGIDFLHTGIVKKVNEERINELLEHGDVVVLSHLGVSSSGTIYHCRSEDVAVQTAIDIKANKLVFLHNGEMLVDMRKLGGAIVHNLPVNVAKSFGVRLAEELGESGHERVRHSDSDPKDQWKLQFLDYLQGAIRSVEGGVHRAHLISRNIHGAIISELCTRDGIGLLISQDLYDGVRPASSHDVPAIKSLITPLENRKILITRPPKQIEKEIDQFIVFEREGMVLACCRLDAYNDPRYGEGVVEMSCVTVSSALHGEGIGNSLLSYCLRCAYAKGIKTLFVLTTRTQGWFIDRGFKEMGPENLPPGKLKTYDYSRNSKIFFKHVENERAIDEEEILWFRKSPERKRSERKHTGM